MPLPRVFIVLATGQAVANLPPLLHAGQAGDTVWWAWSDAGARQSAEPVARQLARRGLRQQWFAEPLPDHAAAAFAWAERQMRRPPFNTPGLTLVGNGGTKPMFQALTEAWAPCLNEVVYGEGMPAVLLRMPGGRAASAWREAFGAPAVELLDLLACSGHGLMRPGVGGSGQALCWWRNGAPCAQLDVPAEFADAPACLDAFERTQHAPDSMRDLGLPFERAVAHRVWQHIESRPAWRVVLAEAWANVTVSALETPHFKAAEWDVLLLLRNGVLLNIECKSSMRAGTKDRKKELDAREHVVHQGASSLAATWLCSPLPTDAVHRPWFTHLHALRYPAAGQRPHLPFTFHGQPRHYRWNGREVSVPSFEEALDALMDPYLPPPGGLRPAPHREAAPREALESRQ